MDWYVTTGVGAKPIGPFPEEQVVEMIRGGMRIVGAHSKEGGEWIAPETHPPFAAAMGVGATPAVMTSPPMPAHRANNWPVVIGTLVIVLLGTFVWAVTSNSPKKESASASSAGKVATPTPATTAETPPERSPVEKILALESFASAIAFAKPTMVSIPNEQSPGTLLLTMWALRRLRWSDVGGTRDETSFALVQKDPDEERGKRMCVGGTIVQISTGKSVMGKLYEGLLITPAQNIFSFLAIGSSGSLVERSWARFCGVATGKYDYSNSGGGVGHAVSIVGMFDLPENKTIVQPTTLQSPPAGGRKAAARPTRQADEDPQSAEQAPSVDYTACRKRCVDTMLPDQVGQCLKDLCGK